MDVTFPESTLCKTVYITLVRKFLNPLMKFSDYVFDFGDKINYVVNTYQTVDFFLILKVIDQVHDI